MESKSLVMPSNYSLLAENELVYVDGGELSEFQVKLLLGTASVVIASFQLLPNVWGYVFKPITTPIVDAFTGFKDSIVGAIKSIFG